MIGSLDKIYSVEGSQNQTPDILKAIGIAKKKAREARQPKVIYLNGTPYLKVDRKGLLITT